MSDKVGGVRVDFETNRVQYQQDVKAILGITKEARNTFNQVMGETARMADRLSGAEATRKLGMMEQAVQRLGGMGGVAKGQLEGLRKEIDSLVASGGKMPSLFEKMPGPAGPGFAAQLGALGNVPGLQGATSTISGLTAQVTGATAALGPLGATLVATGAGVLAVTTVVVGLTNVLKDATVAVMDQASELVGLRDKYGVSIEGLQELKFAAAGVDVELQTVGTGIKNMQLNLAKGDSVFGRLGLDIERLRQLNPQEAFVETGRAIDGLATDYEKTAAAQEVFGKAGGDLVPLFGTEMPAAFEEARRRGLVMSTDTAEGAESLGDAVRELGEQWDAAIQKAGEAIASSPEVKAVFEQLREAIERATHFLIEHKEELAAAASFMGNAAQGVLVLASALEKLGERYARLAGMANPPGWLKQIALDVMTGPFGALAKIGAASKAGADLPDFGDVKGSGSSAKGKDPFISGEALARRQAAAEKAAAQAERVRAAWQKASEDARKEWDKFYEGMEKRGDAAIDGILDSLDKSGMSIKDMAAKHTKDVMADLQNSISIRELAMVIDPATGLWTRYGDVVEQELANASDQMKKSTEDTVDWAAAADQAFTTWAGLVGILGAVGQALDALGVDMDATGGKVLGLAQAGAQLGAAYAKGDIAGMIAGGAAVVASFKSIFDKPEFKRIGEDVGRRFGVAITEGLAKEIESTEARLGVGRHMAELLNLSAIMGESDADPRTFGAHIEDLMNAIALGAVPAREGMEALGDAFDQVRAAAEEAGTVGDATLVAILRRARELGTLTPEMKAFVNDRLDSVIEGVRKFVGGLSKLDGEFDVMGANSATIFMGAFNAVAKERGEAEAFKQLGDSYEVLRDKLIEIGDEAALAMLAPVERWRNYMGNEVLAGAMDAQAGVNQIMRGLLDADFLDVEGFRAMESAAAGLFNHMTEGGMDTKDALLQVAPSIQAAIAAAERFGVPLSEDMQRLKEMAEQNGITFSPDPMTQAADAMGRVATALERILGIGGNVADTFGEIGRRANGIQLPGGGGGGGGPSIAPRGGFNRDDLVTAPELARGGVLMAPLSGAPFVGHGMEGVVPLEGSGADLISARLLRGMEGMAGPRGGGVQIGDMHFMLPDGIKDPEAFAAAAVDAIARGLRGRNVQLTEAFGDFAGGVAQ